LCWAEGKLKPLSEKKKPEQRRQYGLDDASITPGDIEGYRAPQLSLLPEKEAQCL